jgi:hypothetical protein
MCEPKRQWEWKVLLAGKTARRRNTLKIIDYIIRNTNTDHRRRGSFCKRWESLLIFKSNAVLAEIGSRFLAIPLKGNIVERVFDIHRVKV